MRGLIIWATTNCRSTMGLYREIQKQLGVPVCIALYVYSEGCQRLDKGYRIGEFDDVETVYVGEDFGKGCELMNSCRGYNHIFTMFQRAPNFCNLILEASRRGERVAVAAESPCNMSHASLMRWIVKEMYNRFYLPVYSRRIVKACDFFVNYSGSSKKEALSIGWKDSQFHAFGYFPPPLEGSHVVERVSNRNFHVLATGVLSRYRGADVLVDALHILSQKGIRYHATITQRGPIRDEIVRKAKVHSLPISFPGFVKMDELISLYENCSVYVGAGRSEPWGMRLNDALNCGAPLAVSRGMGGVQMVDQYKCGGAFSAGNSEELANLLEKMATDNNYYASCAKSAVNAVQRISPENKAAEFIEILASAGKEWRR